MQGCINITRPALQHANHTAVTTAPFARLARIQQLIEQHYKHRHSQIGTYKQYKA